ncbi:uncharacterized protein LOC130993757 [Salvia miltiorrhiza]|uniref:uncharacterized protein LOC130993757 n=1 Tax=Salvia miltiorrhiza TaxID=226208 RepID=UPI0025AC1EEE|nr:uncharacterized protein LOC130993757 [Salvia miltiorrhiza]
MVLENLPSIFDRSTILHDHEHVHVNCCENSVESFLIEIGEINFMSHPFFFGLCDPVRLSPSLSMAFGGVKQPNNLLCFLCTLSSSLKQGSSYRRLKTLKCSLQDQIQSMRKVAASTNLVRQVSESSSSNAEISNNMALLPFKEKMLYSVFAEDEHLWLDLDYLIMVIGDYPSPSPPNAILNLVEQDLRKISWKPEYRNALALFLQRNNRLTGIHPLFFDIMPDLCFVDLSDTKVSTLPSSLFKLAKLTVLLVRNCDCLETLPPEIGELKTLEVLDLSGTELYQLPDEIGQLQLVKIMKLSFYGPDDESEYKHLPSRLVYPNFLSGIKGIQSLSIAVHPEDHRWSGETVAWISASWRD